MDKYEFVSFVKGNYEDKDTRKQIIILAFDREEGKFKLLITYIDPWKRIDYTEQAFDVKESIFAVKNCNIFMPLSHNRLLKYSGDKIKSIFLLSTFSKGNIKIATLVV